MKNIIFLLLICLSIPLIAQQKSLPMEAIESRKAIAMNAAYGANKDGKYRYYARDEDKPFTGVLYVKYPNGNYETWQEFEEGLGQGTWINYYENGHYKEIGHYEKNRVEGPIKKYHSNGQLASEGTYKDWRIWVGKWKFYDEKGQLIKTENYGQKGNLQEVEDYYQRGDIPYKWYQQIISQK